MEALRIIKTRVISDPSFCEDKDRPCIHIEKPAMYACCGHDQSGGVLEIIEVQPVAKNVMSVAAYVNGLNDRMLIFAD